MPINKYGIFVTTDDERPKSTKKFYRRASPERAAAERVIIKYEGRSNICPRCHMTRPRTGNCCD